METIYSWLYRAYICPAMAETHQEHTEILDKFVKILPEEKRLAAIDLITYIRSQWGLEAFTLGMRLGMELFYAADKNGKDFQILLNFLAQLDQPVT